MDDTKRFRLGKLQRELLLRLPAGPATSEDRNAPSPKRAYPDGLTRAQRESYTRALRRLNEHGLTWSYPLIARGGRSVKIRSSLTPDGVALAAKLRRSGRVSPSARIQHKPNSRRRALMRGRDRA
jgi:hypothetical protein